jgi:hypothetical protein
MFRIRNREKSLTTSRWKEERGRTVISLSWTLNLLGGPFCLEPPDTPAPGNPRPATPPALSVLSEDCWV